MKKVLFLGFAVLVTYLILKTRTKASDSRSDFSKAGKAFANALVSKSNWGGYQADLTDMFKDMMNDPLLQAYVEFSRPYFPRTPEIEEKDGRIIARFDEKTFDITDLESSPFCQGLKSELQQMGFQTK